MLDYYNKRESLEEYNIKTCPLFLIWSINSQCYSLFNLSWTASWLQCFCYFFFFSGNWDNENSFSTTIVLLRMVKSSVYFWILVPRGGPPYCSQLYIVMFQKLKILNTCGKGFQWSCWQIKTSKEELKVYTAFLILLDKHGLHTNLPSAIFILYMINV